MIDSFSGEHEFLSNFYPCVVVYEGWEYRTSEHAYQAAKSCDPTVRQKIQATLKPGIAKRLGRQVQLRPDWNKIRRDVMYEILSNKFSGENELGRMLLNTFPHELVEGNWWGDKYWGVCKGVGSNWLGKLLVMRRNELMLYDTPTDV